MTLITTVIRQTYHVENTNPPKAKIMDNNNPITHVTDATRHARCVANLACVIQAKRFEDLFENV